MIYAVEPQVFDTFPGYVRGVVIAWGCDNTNTAMRLKALVDAEAARVACDPDLEPLPRAADVAAWRSAFSRFGATPSKYPSSLEAILKRARRGDELPYINDLVALGTYLTLRHRLPTGGHDLDRVVGDIRLGIAAGDEEFTPLGGGPMEHPEPGEVIFRDSREVLCRRWVWRQAEVDKVRPETRRLVFNVDGLPPANAVRVAVAMAECESLLHDVMGAQTSRFVLRTDTPTCDLGSEPI